MGYFEGSIRFDSVFFCWFLEHPSGCFFFQINLKNDGFSKHHGFPRIYQYKVISMGIQGARLPNATQLCRDYFFNPLGSPIITGAQ